MSSADRILAPAPRTEPLVTPGRDPVPLTLLTGFLGAGKTTLLNRILNGDHGLRVGVLVNDFGPINIDAELVVGVEDDMISLANGCVCCEVRDDLVEAVERLLDRPEGIEYILLEASGVAEPAGIYATFADPKHADRIRLDSVTCVVDADQAFAYVDEFPTLAMLKLRQVASADLVILNKADLAGPALTAQVRGWIDTQMNRVRIVEAQYCDVPYEILLGVGRFDGQQLSSSGRHHGHGHSHDPGAAFSTWSYESERPFSLEALKEMIRKQLPGTVYRCKGVVYTTDEPDRRAVLQVVGRRTEISLDDKWGEKPRRTQIVAIGAPEGFDEEELRERFDACVTDTLEAKV